MGMFNILLKRFFPLFVMLFVGAVLWISLFLLSVTSAGNNIFIESTRASLPDCVDHGQTCVIGGTPCCDATDTCSGKFPNTYCQ